MKAIELENIYLKFGEKSIFSGFNFSVQTGEKVCLVGPSGRGKTTLISLLAGFVKPESGDVRIMGVKLEKKTITSCRLNLALMPQNLSLIGAGSVRETILAPFNYSVNKSIRPDEHALIRDCSALGLDADILNANYVDISGGEKQRIALIIIKSLKRKIILLDEPTSALDSASAGLAAKYILSDNSAAVLAISHDDEWAANFNITKEI